MTAVASPKNNAGVVRVVPRYPHDSALRQTADTALLSLALDGSRGDVGLVATAHDPAFIRDALSALVAVKESDFRYKGRDRAAYLAFLMKKGKKANKEMWEAQKTFLEASYREQQTTRELDPVVSVHPDEVSFEVFSKDESTYARLAIKNSAFSERSVRHGTTLVQLSKSLGSDIDAIPGYRKLQIAASPKAEAGSHTAVSEQYDVPVSWLRGFLQVQSAATLPQASCTFRPIDLYNTLLQLRMRKAKAPSRGLRFELIPGQRPRIAIEPWDVVLEGHGAVYSGKTARVARVYGRQRLMLLQRLLPMAVSLRVQLLGPGLPSFFVIDLGDATFTLGMTGWSEASWAAASSFDSLVPQHEDKALMQAVLSSLDKDGPQTATSLAAKVKAEPEALREALQMLSLRGQTVFDVADGVYRPRPLFAEPVGDDVVKFGSEREATAHQLLSDTEAVAITKVRTEGASLEVVGEVNDRAAHRSYGPRFMLDVEGRVSEAFCTCPTYRRSGLREGPCEHMIALRVAFGRRRAEEDRLRLTAAGRAVIRAETRTLMRRDSDGKQMTYQVSLDGKIVRLSWGIVTEGQRHQRIWFDTDSEARDTYFNRLEALATDGFVDSEETIG
jgi:hypothetical protein